MIMIYSVSLCSVSDDTVFRMFSIMWVILKFISQKIILQTSCNKSFSAAVFFHISVRFSFLVVACSLPVVTFDWRQSSVHPMIPFSFQASPLKSRRRWAIRLSGGWWRVWMTSTSSSETKPSINPLTPPKWVNRQCCFSVIMGINVIWCDVCGRTQVLLR